MRILWLSPWLRTLARVHVDALAARGHECLLVTTDQHYETTTARPDERVLDPSVKDPATLPALLRVAREVRAWRPDVVVAELVHDPRWLAFLGGAPLVQVVHDDQPHDAAERQPWHRRAVVEHLRRRAAAVVAPSRHVADALAARWGTDVACVPLTSDVPDALVPTTVPLPAAERRDVVLLGRMSPYKNVDVTLRAWAEHVASDAWRGDRLVLVGDGSLRLDDLPPHTEWRRGRFSYPDVVEELAHAKGLVAHYSLATQSGVQLVALQLGVTPVVSPVGGLGEFQPPAQPPVGVTDVAGLAAAFGELADPAVAAERGAAARRLYLERFSAAHAAAAWEAVLAPLSRSGSGQPSADGVPG